jgi:hypothetical protein
VNSGCHGTPIETRIKNHKTGRAKTYMMDEDSERYPIMEKDPE